MIAKDFIECFGILVNCILFTWTKKVAAGAARSSQVTGSHHFVCFPVIELLSRKQRFKEAVSKASHAIKFRYFMLLVLQFHDIIDNLLLLINTYIQRGVYISYKWCWEFPAVEHTNHPNAFAFWNAYQFQHYLFSNKKPFRMVKILYQNPDIGRSV